LTAGGLIVGRAIGEQSSGQLLAAGGRISGVWTKQDHAGEVVSVYLGIAPNAWLRLYSTQLDFVTWEEDSDRCFECGTLSMERANFIAEDVRAAHEESWTLKAVDRIVASFEGQHFTLGIRLDMGDAGSMSIGAGMMPWTLAVDGLARPIDRYTATGLGTNEYRILPWQDDLELRKVLFSKGYDFLGFEVGGGVTTFGGGATVLPNVLRESWRKVSSGRNRLFRLLKSLLLGVGFFFVVWFALFFFTGGVHGYFSDIVEYANPILMLISLFVAFRVFQGPK